MNEGKKFEEDFKKSAMKLNGVWYYRFRDGTSSWGDRNTTRFQQSNICDCQLYCYPFLYLFELKSCLGKSIPIANIIKPNKPIQKQHVFEMINANEIGGINALYVINFREVEETYCIDSSKIYTYIEQNTAKSIPLTWCKDNGIMVEQKKLKTRYRYDIQKLIKGIN